MNLKELIAVLTALKDANGGDGSEIEVFVQHIDKNDTDTGTVTVTKNYDFSISSGRTQEGNRGVVIFIN